MKAGEILEYTTPYPPVDKLVDLVNHPPHYTAGKIEVIDFIVDQKFDYLGGQVIKYLSRYRHKGTPKQDLQKAEFYLKRLIEETL